MEDLARRRLEEALGMVQPDPSLRSRVMSSMPVEMDRKRHPGRQLAIGLVALGLSVTMIWGLVFVGQARSQPAPVAPAASTQVAVLSSLDFQCSLPVAGLFGRSGAPPGSGMLSLPAGTFAPSVGGTKAPNLASYDADLKAWLPVPHHAQSPDGRSYAYAPQARAWRGGQDPTSTVFLRHIESGRDRELWRGQGRAQVLGWNEGSVYFARSVGSDQGSPGSELWSADPVAGGWSSRRVGAAPSLGGERTGVTWSPIAAGTAWGTVRQRPLGGALGRPSPFLSFEGVLGPSQIVSLSLKDGAPVTWYSTPANTFASLLSVNSHGHPLVSVTELVMPPTSPRPAVASQKLVLLNAPGSGRELLAWNGGSLPKSPFAADGVDAHGTWLTAYPALLWLYNEEAGLRLVADLSPIVVSGASSSAVSPQAAALEQADKRLFAAPTFRVAGPCL